MRKQRGPLIHRLTSVSKEELDKEIKKAMDERGITKQAEALRQKEEEIKGQLKDKDTSDEEKRELERRLAEQEEARANLEAVMKRMEEEIKQKVINKCILTLVKALAGALMFTILRRGGCYPGSAIIYDSNSRARRIESL